MIASGSGQLIRGILWCGDVTMEELKRGNEVMKNRLSRAEKEKDVSPETLRRIKRVKRVTQMTEKVATDVLSSVVKVSGLITGSLANSKAGKSFLASCPERLFSHSRIPHGFSK
ncbi:Senescence/dehydration-associated protein [Cardamine amara subsp. amara]|uniref:Senescence/dehydration-associated protein n=1 Tax=Cardamine amara subsp. amara TaxID=228776 RepID=A0ABD0ZYX2_CARAN